MDAGQIVGLLEEVDPILGYAGGVRSRLLDRGFSTEGAERLAHLLVADLLSTTFVMVSGDDDPDDDEAFC